MPMRARMVEKRSRAVRLEVVAKEDVISLKMCENGVLVEYMGICGMVV
jgi:hypothetical protein